MTERPITSISIGRRHRRDLGDIVALANSIREVGLLHPPVITPGGELIAGERRIEAAKSLGWESIPVRIVDIDGIARGELAENAYRKDFTPSEMVAIAATVEDQERELARQRMTLGKISTGSESGKTRDKVAAPLGISGRTLQKATAVVQAAEQEPERFRRLVEEMDRTGKVERFHAELVRVRAADQAAREIPGGIDGIDARVITGDYRTKLGDEVADSSVDLIFTDPPWHRNEVHQYGDLAEWAARKLVDGGSLICYAGNFALPEILPLMVPHVRYWWTLAVFHGGGTQTFPGKFIFVGWKPLLWFVKESRRTKSMIRDCVTSEPGNKMLGNKTIDHPWAQGEIEAETYVEHLSRKGSLVCDPYTGGGTTGAVAVRLGRRFVGFEIDPATARRARSRILRLRSQEAA